MVTDAEMNGWYDLLHSSSKLLEQTAATSSQFPPIQRNLEQLEALSKKLEAKNVKKTEAPSQQEINAEKLARDLKWLKMKKAFDDDEATSVEEHVQQKADQTDNLDVSKKAAAYGEVVKDLNSARQNGSPFKPAAEFMRAYDSLGIHGSGVVGMQKIWHLLDQMMSSARSNGSRKMSLLIGARHHLEHGHEKHMLDAIQSHPSQAALNGAVDDLHRIRAFLRIRLRDIHGVLDFDADHNAPRENPPLDTTWQQVYFCLRSGYYDKAQEVAKSSPVSQHFAPMLHEWIACGGMVSGKTSAAAFEECENLLRTGYRAYDKMRLVLYAIISGSRRLMHRLLGQQPSLFCTIEDFLWFNLSAIRESSDQGFSPYTLDDLQMYLNKFEPPYYTKKGKDPLVYPYVLLLSIQLLPAVQYLCKDEAFNVDSVHMCIALADHGVFFEGSKRVMDAYAQASSIVKKYGSAYLHDGDLAMALEYYAQAAAAVGGAGRGSMDQQRQKTYMLKQLMMELLLSDDDGGVHLLLGPGGTGEEGQLARFLADSKARQQFLLEASHRCRISGMDDKSIELQRRAEAFSGALSTVNRSN